MTKDDLIRLAHKLADEAKEAGARGVLIGVSADDGDKHSAYGIAARGPCLEIEGLGARLAQYLRELWAYAEAPPHMVQQVKPGQFVEISLGGQGGSGARSDVSRALGGGSGARGGDTS